MDVAIPRDDFEKLKKVFETELLKGAKFANTGTVLVNVRVGKEMYRRRCGMKYFNSEAKLQKYMLERRVIG